MSLKDEIETYTDSVIKIAKNWLQAQSLDMDLKQ
jgi:hypothetical protein